MKHKSTQDAKRGRTRSPRPGRVTRARRFPRAQPFLVPRRCTHNCCKESCLSSLGAHADQSLPPPKRRRQKSPCYSSSGRSVHDKIKTKLKTVVQMRIKILEKLDWASKKDTISLSQVNIHLCREQPLKHQNLLEMHDAHSPVSHFYQVRGRILCNATSPTVLPCVFLVLLTKNSPLHRVSLGDVSQ